MTDKSAELNTEELRQKLNLETGRLHWSELQRHFARGVVVVVEPELDLVETAACFVEDNKTKIENWINQGQISRANDEHAKRWTESESDFWAIVVTPWVLVQEINNN